MEEAEREKQIEILVARYRREHQLCPVCYKKSYRVSTRGITAEYPDYGLIVDHSAVWCDNCAWKGEVDNLIPNALDGEANSIDAVQWEENYHLGRRALANQQK